MSYAILFFLSASFLGKASCLDHEAQHAKNLTEQPPYIFITPPSPPRERNKKYTNAHGEISSTINSKSVTKRRFTLFFESTSSEDKLLLIAMAQGHMPEAPGILRAILQLRALARTPIKKQ